MNEETLDSTTSQVSIIENGSDEEIRMLLGDRNRIRHTGIVRVGKQVPKKSCTEKEKALFEKLEAEGLPYDQINQQMGGVPRGAKSKLTMTNMDCFVIHERDFKRPADAEFIQKQYADADGKVRTIPIFFTVTTVDQAIPHGFTAFNGGGQLRCKSFYDGDDLKFKYLNKSVTAPKNSDWKILDTDDEEEASKACGYPVTFSGMYRVNVVGLRGIGECLVPNKSWNGMGDAVAVLNKVYKRLGRFDGLLNGQSMFNLCKVREYVKHEGKKVLQSIVTIELSVDPMEIERHAEQLEARGRRAIGLFNGIEAKPAAGPASTSSYEEQEPVQEPADQTDLSERRKRCLAYMTQLEKLLQLAPGQMGTFATVSNFGTSIDGLSDDEIAAFCNSMKSTMATKEPETVKNDILAAIGG